MKCPICKQELQYLYYQGSHAEGSPYGEYESSKTEYYKCNYCNKEIALYTTEKLRVKEWKNRPRILA